jgi:hypothetical protein
MLSAKLGLHDLPAPQHGPKLLFRGRGSASQSTCLESPGAQQTRRHAFLSAPRRNRLPLFRLRPPSPFGRGAGGEAAYSRMPRCQLRAPSCSERTLAGPVRAGVRRTLVVRAPEFPDRL